MNCLKADYNKIFNNDIITDLLKVLGCGVEIKSKHQTGMNSFDLEQLRWSKVILNLALFCFGIGKIGVFPVYDFIQRRFRDKNLFRVNQRRQRKIRASTFAKN